MKLGIAFHAHWEGHNTQADVFKYLVDQVVLAEKLGYYSAWTTEHHFANDPNYRPFGYEEAKYRAYDLAPDPLVLLAYCAAVTKEIRLGTGVLMVNYDNPVRLAERAAMLDQMSGGRLELGLGRGQMLPHSEIFGCPPNDVEGQEYYREALEIILRSWTGERFAFRGKYFNFSELEVVPTPLQKPYQNSEKTGVPLYTSSQNDENLAEAARQGMSHVTTAGAWGPSSVDRYNHRHKIFAQAMTEAGMDPAKELYPTHLFMYVAETDAEAEEVGEEHMLKFVAHVESHYERQRNGGLILGPLFTGPNARENDVRAAIRRSFPTSLIGSPKTVAEKLQAFLESAPSINYVGAITDGGSPPVEFVNKSMELFATQVMPKFMDFREPPPKR